MRYARALIPLLLIISPLTLAAQQVRQLTTAKGGTVRYRQDPNIVILSLLEEPGELREEDPGPSVRIFGDGRALLHYPAYMKNSGDFELRLTGTELDALMRTVAERKLPEFDGNTVKRRKREVLAERRQRRATVYETSDATVSTVSLELEEYQPSAAASAARRTSTPVKRSLRWPALQFDAEQLPEIAEIQDLNAVCTQLRSIMERPDRRRLR